jgi:hypothetical protein
MRNIFGLVVGTALLWGCAAGAMEDCEEVESGSNIVAKAQQLVTGKTTRLQKLTALQTFVRDDIAEARTQYG